MKGGGNSPNVSYLTKSAGKGSSSVVTGGSKDVLSGGVKDTNKHNPTLSGNYMLSGKSVKSGRKM